MKRKFLSILAAFAVLVSLSACQAGNTEQTPPLSEAAVSETTVALETAVSSEETTAPQKNSTHNPIEFEITDWTMEELVSNMVIENHTFSLPCTISEINTDYKIENTVYFEDIQKTGGTILKNNKEIATIYFNGDVVNDTKKAEIKYLFLGGSSDLPEFDIMGITEKSTRSDVTNILGNPNMHINESDIHFQYGFSENKYVIIDFTEENPDKIYQFLIIYNVEDKK